ncbi:Leucine Rich repeats (2 copies) [Gimesia maris]|uniref:hypothetical protein n=1 Tax=Gimesia maris TaxID=122 RepID=UPI001188892A|nr:hypothetical protein [Gimesia maris]QDT80291.1 Leucine Rich repeats (2 copies) [Gimesia maris]
MNHAADPTLHGILKRTLRSRWFWGVSGLSLLVLTFIATPLILRYRTLFHIAALDGTIDYEQPTFEFTVFPSNWENVIRQNRDKNQMKSFDEVESISLDVTQDSDLVWLNDFPNLERISLSGKGLSNTGLVHLKRFHRLKRLMLWNTSVSDDGLVHLKELSQLNHLDLFYTPVSGSGLAHLQGLTNLTWLNLQGTAVTNAG